MPAILTKSSTNLFASVQDITPYATVDVVVGGAPPVLDRADPISRGGVVCPRVGLTARDQVLGRCVRGTCTG